MLLVSNSWSAKNCLSKSEGLIEVISGTLVLSSLNVKIYFPAEFSDVNLSVRLCSICLRSSAVGMPLAKLIINEPENPLDIFCRWNSETFESINAQLLQEM